MNKYEFKEHKQGIYKNENNTFEVVSLGNCVTTLTKNELLCYLCADGATSIEEIKANICEFYSFTELSKLEIENIIRKLISIGLLIQCPIKKELHKHVSFNKSLLKQIDLPVKKRTILSIADIELSITDLCPFKCTYCSKKKNITNKEYISIDEWKKVIKDAYTIGANGIKLTGGEPLHPEAIDKTLELAKFAKIQGYNRIVLLTSGYHLDRNIRKIVEAGITEISISYNMINSHQEDRIRNQYVENHFDSFLILKEYNIKLNLCCVLNKESILLVDKVLQFALDKGVDCIHFFPVMPVGQAKFDWENHKLDVNTLRNTMKYLETKREELKEKIYISAEQMYLSKKENISVGCEALNYWTYISEDGYVGSCACAELSGENIKKKSIIKIWRDSIYFESLRSFNDDNECQKCRDRKYCVNNCYLRLLQKDKNNMIYNINNCFYKRANRKQMDL